MLASILRWILGLFDKEKDDSEPALLLDEWQFWTSKDEDE